jgi:hypothetical protein
MKKLTLDVDDLRVESFEPQVSDRRKGTVQGHEVGWSDDSICPTVTDFGRCCPP